MTNRRIGLSDNYGSYAGRVRGEPQFVPGGNGEVAFINLATTIVESGANGQWTEMEQIVPLMVQDPNKVNVVKKYVKDGKQLLVKTYYKSWEVNGVVNHANVVTTLKLGSDLFKPQGDGGQLPPLPQ